VEHKKEQENHGLDQKKEHEHKHHKEEHAPKADEKQAELVKEKEAKIIEMTDKYMRALAELENYRKRTSKDKEDFVKYTRRDTVSEVLPVLDNLQRAIAAAKEKPDFESLKQGIEIVTKHFEDILKKMGAQEIGTSGIFDHDLHHVMLREHRDDKEDGTILDVYQKGYSMDGMVIRPAMVKVAVKETGEMKPEAEDEKLENGKQKPEAGKQ